MDTPDENTYGEWFGRLTASSSESAPAKTGFIGSNEAAVIDMDLVILIVAVPLFTDPPGYRKLDRTR